MRVSNIQRFSVDDGPGIRTTVFLAGCNLRCRWCHNPETIPLTPVLSYDPQNCIHCGRCAAACTGHAHQMTLLEGHGFLRKNCRSCMGCIAACPAGALKSSFHEMPPDALLAELQKDRPFYGKEGGVTFSGGEPMLQRAALLETTALCRAQGLGVAIDTAANVPAQWFEPFYELVALFLLDCKAVTDTLHIAGTGVSNGQILRNLSVLSRRAKDVWIRVPVIPGWNNAPQEMERIARFLADLPVSRVELLPYHAMGSGKYEAYGITPQMPPTPAPEDGEMRLLLGIFQKHGLPVVCTALENPLTK